MDKNNIPFPNIPLGQLFILTNPSSGIAAKNIRMMEMAKQYSQIHIVNTIPVDDSRLWDCCICVVDRHPWIFSGAIQSADGEVEDGDTVRILHRMTQGADHPVNIYHPEGQYLKGLLLYVE